MELDEDGERIKSMKKAVGEITSVYDLANLEGLRSVNFFNAEETFSRSRNRNYSSMFKRIRYGGVERIGPPLSEKVLDTLVWKNPMKKPLLVIIITDGAVSV